jgi:hypothetical protein
MNSTRRDAQPPLFRFEPADRGAEISAPVRVGGGKSGKAIAGAPAVPNSDLVGRDFLDREERVVVTDVSRANPSHVVVRRERDGHSWTIPAGIVRMILPPARRRHAA